MPKILVRLTDGRALAFEHETPAEIIQALCEAGVTSTDQIVETIHFIPAGEWPPTAPEAN